MALRICKTGENLGCRNHILVLDVFVLKKMRKCLVVNWGKNPELKPNRKRNNYIQKKKKEMQERDKPCEGAGGKQVL